MSDAGTLDQILYALRFIEGLMAAILIGMGAIYSRLSKCHEIHQTRPVLAHTMNPCGTHFSHGRGWVLLFGCGVYWIDTKMHDLLFSERMGLRPHIRIGRWYIAPYRLLK